MKFSNLLFLFLLISNFSISQIVGGRDNGEISPKSVEPSKLSAGTVVSDVNILNGEYTSTIPLGGVSTTGGLSFGVSLDYSSTISIGTTAPVCSGIPYGEGWNLSLPTITVETESFHKYTKLQEENQHKPCTNPSITEILRYDMPETYTGKDQGDLYWFSPQLSIPGVVSGKLVFKYFDNITSSFIFGLNAFESPVEVRLKNTVSGSNLSSVWTVILADGTTYLFNQFQYSYTSPDNTRVLTYDNCNGLPANGGGNAASVITNDSYQLATGDISQNVYNVIVPKVALSSWYCTKITNSSIENQEINLVYTTYGNFNFNKELLVFGNDYTSAKDILLKEINSKINGQLFEKLELDHQTLTSLLSLEELIDYNGTDAGQFDNLYSYKTVYSQGATSNFSSWSRYAHGKADILTSETTNVNPYNPYLVTNNGVHYKRNSLSTATSLNFDHGFLESGRITSSPTSHTMIPGDIYELVTNISNTRGTVDLAIVTGDLGSTPSTSGSGYSFYNQTNAYGYADASYEKTRGIELFSTFNSAIKWYKSLNGSASAGYSNTLSTSNFFVMPNVPNDYEGFHIQIGAGNSDVDYTLTPNQIWVDMQYDPFNGKQGYSFMPESNKKLYKSAQTISHSFGNGYPWSMVEPFYKTYLGLTTNDDISVYTTWWSTQQYATPTSSSNTSHPIKWNRPTSLGYQDHNNNGNPAKLNSVKLIRYSKNPYMLQGIKMYRNNSGTMELISQKKLEYDYKKVDLVENFNLVDYPFGTNTPHLDNTRQRVIVLLKRVRELPLNASMYAVNYGLTVADTGKIMTTFFSYTPLDLSGVSDIYSSIKGVSLYTLNRVVNPLGGITDITYNIVTTADFYSTLPSISPTTLSIAYQYSYGNNQAFLLMPTVASVSKTSEIGVQTYSYTYSNPIQMVSHYNLNEDHFRNNFVKSARRGFKNVRVTKPLINGINSYTDIVHYGPLKTDIPTQDNPIVGPTYTEIEYLCYGKIKSSQEYMNGVLNNELSYTYDYTLAFENGAIRPSYKKDHLAYDANMGSVYLYEDYYLLQSNYTSLSENKADLIALENSLNSSGYQELPKMLEGYFYNELLSANYNKAFLFNSYFVKLVSQSKKVYDDGLSKIANAPALCYDRDGNPIPCTTEPLVIEPASCSNAVSTARRYIETKTEYNYYEADFRGKAQGTAYHNLFAIDPANPKTILYSTYGLGSGSKSNGTILLKHEPSWQIASVKNSSPQMGYANAKEEYFYFYDLVNRYDRHWYLFDITGNPKFSVQVVGNDTIAINNTISNSARLNSTSLPRLEGMESSRANSTRSLAYQKTAWMQNANDPKPLSKSEYYHYDNSWTFQVSSTYKPVLLRSAFVQIDTLDYTLPSLDFRNSRTDRSNTYISEFKATTIAVADAYGKLYVYSLLLPFDNLKVKNINTRNTYLQPTNIENQMGVKTLYTFNTTLTNINFGLVTSVQVGYTLPDVQTTSYLYTSKGLIQKVTEPTLRTLEYEYDNYLRLTKVTENGTRILSQNEYNLWGHSPIDNFILRTDQNFVKATINNSSTANDFEINKSFIDPLGRNHSTLQVYIDETSTLIRQHSPTIVYDNWNRVQKTYKPYIGPVTANLNLGSNTTTPFVEQQFENQVSSRSIKSADYGENITTSTHTSRQEFSIINGVILFCELGLTNDEAKMVITSRGNGGTFNFVKHKVIDQDNKETIKYTNAFGQVVATVTYTTGTTTALTLFGYDSYGKLNKVINPNKQVITYLYNILGELVKETSVDGGTTKNMYNKLGLVSVSQTEEERTRLNTSGVLSPVYRVYKYDNYGKVISVGIMNVLNKQTYPLLYETTITPNPGDPANPIFKYIFSNGSTYDWICSYTQSSKNGPVTTTMTPSYFVTSTFEKSFEYGITPSTNTIGKLIKDNSYNNAGVKILKNTYTYTNEGVIASQTTVFSPVNADGTTGLSTTKIDYPSYNYRASLLEEKIDLDNDNVVDFHLFYQYDKLNRLVGINGALGLVASINDATKLVSYQYDVSGQLTKKQHFVDDNSNLSKLAMEIMYSYDVRDRLTQIDAKRGTTSIMKYNLFYDTQNPLDGAQTVLADQNWNGNINGALMTYNFGSASNLISTFTAPTLYGYKYDKMNRLVQADARVAEYVAQNAVDGPKVGDELYTYDKIGNITSLQRFLKGITPTFAQIEQWNYNYQSGTNRLTGVTGVSGTANRNYTYDANGNLLTDSYKQITQTQYGRASYAYRVTKGTDVIDYLYDTKDQRMYKKVDAVDNNFDTEEYYIQDAFGRTIAIRKNLNGAISWNYYVSGSERELSIQPLSSQSPSNNTSNTVKRIGFGRLINYLYDHLGNTRVSYTPVAWDAVNAVCNYTVSYIADYSPYGKIVREFKSGEPTKYVTTQHERDGETGLDYRGARYYDCDVVRFLSVDPWADKYVSWSTYNYVLGNPILLIDPSGNGPDNPPTKKYQGVGGDLILPTDAKIENLYLDENGDGEISLNGKVVPEAKDKDVWKFDVNGTTYAAQYKDGKFNGYWDSKGNKYQIPKPSIEPVEKNEEPSINPVGPALILLGQPIKALKPIAALGSKPGSSIASYTLSKAIPARFTTVLGKKLGTKVATSVGTNVIGRAAGRAVPYVGVALTVWDVSYYLGGIYGPQKWYGTDDYSIFK